jgi:hypothetical protein
MTMTNADQAYDDLIEISARSIAFGNLTGRALPRRVHQLISEAAYLRGAWDKYSGEGPPGSADLPIVDAVIEEAYSRADSLRGEIFGEVRYAGTTDVSVRLPAAPTLRSAVRYAGMTDATSLDATSLDAQVRALLARVHNGH